jgi:hypothetical protein
MENLLDPRLFQRVHRSTIVNLTRVKSLRAHMNGEYFLRLEGGQELKLSRTYRDKVEYFLKRPRADSSVVGKNAGRSRSTRGRTHRHSRRAGRGQMRSCTPGRRVPIPPWSWAPPNPGLHPGAGSWLRHVVHIAYRY